MSSGIQTKKRLENDLMHVSKCKGLVFVCVGPEFLVSNEISLVGEHERNSITIL